MIRNSENPNYRHKKVVIESADVVTFSNFRKVGDDRYIATAHYLQKYPVYYSADMERAGYHDYTAKTMLVFINLIEIEHYDGNTEQYYCEIKLGDVECDDVW